MNLGKVLIAFALVGLNVAEAASVPWRVRSTGDDWTRVESYVYAWATYRIACEPSRRCEVGAGWKLFDKPRGQRTSFEGSMTMVVVGAGSLYARPADGLGPVEVGVILDSSTNVSATVPW